MKVVGIYLAAGNSERMGTNKLELPVGKMTLGSLALDTALKSLLEKVIVVVKETDDVHWISSNIKSDDKIIIEKCTTAHEGKSESIKCGILRAQEEGADAAMVILADQPFITELILNELIECMKKTPTSNYVSASHNQLLIPPVLFSGAMFPELLNLTGDTGAKTLLEDDYLAQGKELPCADSRLIFGIDTTEEYEELLSITKNNSI